MLSDEFFEHLFPTSRDVEPVPYLPDPVSGQTSCIRSCPGTVPSGNFPSGTSDKPSQIFEILSEELRYLAHPRHTASLHSGFSAELDEYESEAIL